MFIGIDLGTSSVKVILMQKNGDVIKSAKKAYTVHSPYSTWSEQHPNDWLKMTILALSDVIKGNENNIKGISFSGQMHGLVLLDEKDNVIRNAILWNDQRTTKEVDYLNNVIGIEKLIEETGNIAVTGLTAPKVLWVYENEINNFKAISKIMLPKDYLIYKLTGVFASDVSDLSGTLYFNPRTKDYSDFMLNVLKINRKQLPKVFESFDVVANLTDEYKKMFNLTSDVKIIAGGGDQAVGAIGVGIVEEGKCSISLGTSGVVFTAMNEFAVDNETFLQSYADSNGKYHMMGVMLNAAGALKWWSEDIFKEHNYDRFFDDIKDVNIDNDLMIYPYFNGERAPINDPEAKGIFLGVEYNHRKQDLDKALIEGITFNLKQIYQTITKKGIKVDVIRVTGGGAKSDVWVQMIADIFNVKIETIVIEEGPALGAAILAMVGTGEFTNVEEACKAIIKAKEVFIPNNDNVAAYDQKYYKYVSTYRNLK